MSAGLMQAEQQDPADRGKGDSSAAGGGGGCADEEAERPLASVGEVAV